MRFGRGSSLALVALVAGTTQCSLIAPSDAELMGGASSSSSSGADGGSSKDSGNDGADGAMPLDGAGSGSGSDGSSSGSCVIADDCCTKTSDCCSGLACEPNATICVPCVPKGGSCSNFDNLCCSGSCTGHTCN